MPQCRQEREKKYTVAFSLYGHAPAQVKIFGRLFRGHHNLVCLYGSRKEDSYRKIAFSLCDLYGHALEQETLPRGS